MSTQSCFLFGDVRTGSWLCRLVTGPGLQGALPRPHIFVGCIHTCVHMLPDSLSCSSDRIPTSPRLPLILPLGNWGAVGWGGFWGSSRLLVIVNLKPLESASCRAAMPCNLNRM